MAPAPHEPLKALGPINWDFGHGNSAEEQSRIRRFLFKTFADAECIIDSIPIDSTSTSTSTAPQTGRPRSATDPNRQDLPSRTRQPSDCARELRKEWKEVKVNAKENPLGLSVYKLTAKDGKGSWFARRSVHEGQSFEKWKLAMEKEFAESMKVKGKPGSGSIRGIGADKRVEHMILDGCGKLEVYQLSAQFPGPTTPREFVTMLMTTDCGLESSAPATHERYFMVVSKPCQHPDCPQQSGFIRGAYESVEMIREIRTEIKIDPLRKVQSSIDLPADEANAIARNTMNQLAHEAPIRAARQPTLNGVPEADVLGHQSSDSLVTTGSDQQHQRSPIKTEEEYETKIEWLMVTRSDPGGSVPRFMVEKGTPSAIAGDADKFLKWAESKTIKYFTQPEKVDAEPKLEAPTVGEASKAPGSSESPFTKPSVRIVDKTNGEKSAVYEEDTPAYTGLYGIIAGAIGAAATMIPTFGSVQGDTSPERSLSTDEDDDDDRSSIRTFHSFVTGQENPDEPGDAEVPLSRIDTNGEDQSLHSSTESTATHSFNASSSQHEKELRKLEERKRKMEERLQRSQARVLAKRNHESNSNNNEEDALAKLREKHDREVAKQTEKYQRELRKLEAKRHSDQRKAEERRRKQVEREEKANLTMELEKVRVERDVARKQIEVLKEHIGELQGQNTMLVARLGREGISLEGGILSSSDPRRKGSPAPGGKISRASTVLGTPSQSSTSPMSGPTKGDRSRERGRNNLQAEGVA